LGLPSRFPAKHPEVGFTAPTGTLVRANHTGSARSESLLTTTAASTAPERTSINKRDATLTSVPFSSRRATDTMNLPSGTSRPHPSWSITGQPGRTICERLCGPSTASGAVPTLDT